VPIEEANMINSNSKDLFYVSNEMAEITWNKDSLLPRSITESYNVTITVNIQLSELNAETGAIQSITNLASDVSNNGHYEVEIPLMYNSMSTAVLQITVAEVLSNSFITSIPEHIGMIYNHIKEATFQWSNIIYVSGSNYLRDQCDEWCDNEPEGIEERILERLPPCPPTVSRAEADSIFKEDDPVLVGDILRGIYHPGASSCFRQVVFTE